jgi:transcriptional regulator with XRE-family HTH domain
MNKRWHQRYTRMYIPAMNIASRLDEAMRKAGFESQSALHRASGVPQPTINRILKGVGKKGPEAHTLVKLAQACNVSFDWLHEGQGEYSKSTFRHAEGFDLDAIETPPPARVQLVTDDEYNILSWYRCADQRGRERIKDVAKDAVKTLFPDSAHNKS